METILEKEVDASMYEKIIQSIKKIMNASDYDEKIKILCVIDRKKFGCVPIRNAAMRWDGYDILLESEKELVIDFDTSYKNYSWCGDIENTWRDKINKLSLVENFVKIQLKQEKISKIEDNDVLFIINWFKSRLMA
ncbi:TPA: hypothetical protein DEP21_01900 [Patescibacteria group bacterium]|nr:hypothetical protein [Candidatus Gracilibacteria bacterium]